MLACARTCSHVGSLSVDAITVSPVVCSLDRDVAPVVEVLPDLAHLNLGYNQLQGSLSCRLLTADRQLAELDLADNQVSVQ